MPGNGSEQTFNFIQWLFDPTTISTIVTFTSIVAGGTVRVWKKLEKKQNKDIEAIRSDVQNLSDGVHSTLSEVKLDNIRLQILAGLNSHSMMSLKEIMTLYDEYKRLGGNSYISRMVEEAVQKKLKGGNNG